MDIYKKKYQDKNIEIYLLSIWNFKQSETDGKRVGLLYLRYIVVVSLHLT